MALEDRFEVLKEIGDGSFGNVVLARVRTAGANIARRGTVVRINAVAHFERAFSNRDTCRRLPSSR
jgi:meiosis induction protein kinase IME2/SME1